MDSLIKSDKSVSYSPKNNMRATNTTSSFFKSTGRDTDAHWANRFMKDVNDLTYNLNFSQIRSKNDFIGSANQFRLKKRFSVGGKVSKEDKKQIDKHALRIELMKANKVQNPEFINIVQQQQYSTLETQGLCKFEFDKTIAGKLKNRQSRHLYFSHQVARQKYNKEMDQSNQSFYSSQESKIVNKLYKTLNIGHHINPKYIKQNKCHDFESYSPRRVFQPKEQLDKFYDVEKVFQSAKTRTIRQTVKMSGIVGRIQPKPKQSQSLEYESHVSKNFVLKQPQQHKIGKSPRKTELGRQVISPQRGCYR